MWIMRGICAILVVLIFVNGMFSFSKWWDRKKPYPDKLLKEAERRENLKAQNASTVDLPSSPSAISTPTDTHDGMEPPK